MSSVNSANLSYGSLVLADGTGGSANYLVVSNYQDGANSGAGARLAVQHGTIANITANDVGPYPAGLNPVVLRIERASGAHTAEFSPDGINGQRFSFTPGFTPTNFGLGGAPFTGELRLSFGTFRYNSTSTTRWGAYL